MNPVPKRPRGRPRKHARMAANDSVGGAYLPARPNTLGQHQRIWAVFTDETRIPWLRVLRPGFRHCFAILNDGRHWTAVEPLSNCLEVTILPPGADFNLPEFLRAQGHKVVEAELRRHPHPQAQLAILNCVEVVKRMLGISLPWIVTPYQLYRHLERAFESARRSVHSANSNAPQPLTPISPQE